MSCLPDIIGQRSYLPDLDWSIAQVHVGSCFSSRLIIKPRELMWRRSRFSIKSITTMWMSTITTTWLWFIRGNKKFQWKLMQVDENQYYQVKLHENSWKWMQSSPEHLNKVTNISINSRIYKIQWKRIKKHEIENEPNQFPNISIK